MKSIGIVIMAIGAAMLIFVLYNFVAERNRTVSPVPEDKGVKVIFITPSSK